MPAFVIVEIKVNDPVRYEDYKKMSTEAVSKFGGKFIVRGGKAEKLEGTADPERVVILQFDSVERAREWWNSPEYAEAKKLRHETAESRMIVVEGL
jgi:uncharacterized protein (DUF1330 family)